MAHRSERLRVVVGTPLAEQHCELIERLEPRSRFLGLACSASVRRRAAAFPTFSETLVLRWEHGVQPIVWCGICPPVIRQQSQN